MLLTYIKQLCHQCENQALDEEVESKLNYTTSNCNNQYNSRENSLYNHMNYEDIEKQNMLKEPLNINNFETVISIEEKHQHKNNNNNITNNTNNKNNNNNNNNSNHSNYSNNTNNTNSNRMSSSPSNQQQLSIDKKIDDYVRSFTIHGLTRSVKGRKIEAFFWSCMLLVGILSAFIVVYGLIRRYNSHAVYTEVKSQITDSNNFPSITLCEETLLKNAYFSYCGSPIHEPGNKTGEHCPPHMPYQTSNSTVTENWSSPYFRVGYCFSWGGVRCDNAKYFTSKANVNHSCITWNFNGDFHDPYSHVNIELDFFKPAGFENEVEIFAIPHDHRILEIDLTKKIELDADHKYEIKIDKTFIKRLPAPFPSNCTNDENGNIFPGRYTRFSCIESHYYIDMFKRCGDVFDYHKPYIPENVIRKYKNENNTNVKKCIIDYAQKEFRNLKHCQFACEILDLNYYSTSQTRTDQSKSNETRVYRYDIGIQLKTANEYRVMEEKQLYTLSQMACEIGGFVGLIMGMSVMSLIEVLVIVCLTIAKKITNIR